MRYQTLSLRLSATLTVALCLTALTRTALAEPNVDALLYSTMPSTFAHSPVMAMDGDEGTWFRTSGGMSTTDFFLVELSQPSQIGNLDIQTGDDQGYGAVTNGVVEGSVDGVDYQKIADFDGKGRAVAVTKRLAVRYLRIKTKLSLPELDIREIAVGSPVGRVLVGPGRGFVDTSRATDVAGWAAHAESEMEEFWPDVAARLYSNKFITPNAVTVIYKTEKDGVAATGDGVMDVNADWCRHHPDDTGLTVHELAHVVQAYDGSAPGWFVEGTADYIRWIRFEPENFRPRIDVLKASYTDKYRTTAAFLGWCELHYDPRLVTKLNDAARSDTFDEALFKKYCGKDIHALWTAFLADYTRDPKTLLASPTPAADIPRPLPTVKPGTSTVVDLTSSFTAIGIYPDGATFPNAGGLDTGGAAYSATLLGPKVNVDGVDFAYGPPAAPDFLPCNGKSIKLPQGKYVSIWLLGCSTNGASRNQSITVRYTDGTRAQFSQNVSDWFHPSRFPGEVLAKQSAYRNLATGDNDARPFNVYAYAFALDPTKTVDALVLPNSPSVELLAVSLSE